MCGIAGIISLNGIDAFDLKSLSTAIKHRGPDDEGFSIINTDYSFENYKGDDTISELFNLPYILDNRVHKNALVGLMHRRLSILDLSPAGHQPMSFKNNKYHIVFNGEVYNYKELRKELQMLEYTFVSDTDTEVILAAFDKWGKNCVDKFVGMWAIALLDIEKCELFLSRDRFGIKPLYYFSSQNKFAFASEIKALLSLEFIKPEADMKSVYEFVTFGTTSDPNANLFKQIQILPPAHNLIIDLNTLAYKTENYYDLEKNVRNYTLPPENKIQDTFNELINNAIDIHLRSDVPVGSTLSGGLDSSTIVSLAAKKMQGKTFKTFTAAYHEKDIDESDYAKKVISAQHNIEGHFIYPNKNDYWKDLDNLIWHQDLPINSTSMYAQWEVMKLASSQNIKVLLDGQGADEILGGYYNFAGIYLIELLKKIQVNKFFREKNELKDKFSPNIENTIGRALYYFMPEFAQRSIRGQKRLGMNFISPEYSEILKTITVPNRGGKTYKEQSLLSTQFGLQDLLRYEDRNSMAFSIESRVPFLDHRLVEFAIAIDNDWKIKNGWTKYILRKTAEPIVDKDVAWRKFKMGFLTPQKDWKIASAKELNIFVNEVELPYFMDKSYLLKLNADTLTDASHLSEFWKIISFLKWSQLFKVTFS